MTRVVKLAFEFPVVTATRSGKVRLAIWDEIDAADSSRRYAAPVCRIGNENCPTAHDYAPGRDARQLRPEVSWSTA